MDFAIDDPHDNLIAIDEAKFAADVSWELQTPATDEPAFVHAHCTIF